MYGHFAVFNQWTEIRSVYEGHFLERIAPTAFDESFRHADNVRVLFDHGHDPSIGNKPLGVPTMLRSDDTGAAYEVDLFDTDYVAELTPALRAGALGASFRFRVTGEQWNETPARTDTNPDRLPERTLTGVDLFEFGPVAFAAYPAASAGMRSRTDEFVSYFDDPAFVARFTDRVGLRVAEQLIASLPGDLRSDDTPPADKPADGGSEAPPPPQGRLVAAALTDLRKRNHR
jgi:HK97 family phage prohead protease